MSPKLEIMADVRKHEYYQINGPFWSEIVRSHQQPAVRVSGSSRNQGEHGRKAKPRLPCGIAFTVQGHKTKIGIHQLKAFH